MKSERRSTHVRVSDHDHNLIERLIKQLSEKYPNRAIGKGEAITYALEFTLGIEDEEKTEKRMVNIFS